MQFDQPHTGGGHKHLFPGRRRRRRGRGKEGGRASTVGHKDKENLPGRHNRPPTELVSKETSLLPQQETK